MTPCSRRKLLAASLATQYYSVCAIAAAEDLRLETARIAEERKGKKKSSACRGEGSAAGLQLRVRIVPAALLAMLTPHERQRKGMERPYENSVRGNQNKEH
jgi:hypothetical protein